MKRALLTLAVVVATLGAPSAQEPKPDLAADVARATEAYKAKDYATFVAAYEHAIGLVPDHPRIWYNLACGYALTGKPEKAVAMLERLAAAGLVYPAADDTDFAAIRESAPFKAVLERFAANLAPVHHAETAFTIPEKGLVTEGVAYDPVGGAFYVSSVHKRKVMRVDRSGAVSDFVANRPELWAALGLRVDAKRRVLWVTTAAMPQMVGYDAKDEGRSGVLEYDLKTAKLLGTFLLDGAPEKHSIADLTLSGAGDVYLTDSETPAVYAIRRGRERLERLPVAAPFVSPQGIAFSGDERRLFVADYARGIFVVDAKTMEWAKLEHPDDVCLLGFDGLCFAGGALYATQNGIRPKRVVRIALDATGLRAARLDVLESSTPGLGEPTLGAVVDGWFYFVAESQWDRFDDKGNLPPESDLRPHAVMRVRL
jgi:sugar lactone lactonase YvrE